MARVVLRLFCFYILDAREVALDQEREERQQQRQQPVRPPEAAEERAARPLVGFAVLGFVVLVVGLELAFEVRHGIVTWSARARNWRTGAREQTQLLFKISPGVSVC